MNKEDLRNRIRKLKNNNFAQNMEQYYWKAEEILNHVVEFEFFKKSTNIGFFASKLSSYEVFTDDLVNFSLENKKKVYLPRCIIEIHNLEFIEIKNLKNDTVIATFSLREPKLDLSIENQENILKKMDIIFVPGMAFDLQGNRMGFGNGYYDRFLSNLKEINPNIPIVGLAFDFQIFNENIPHEEYDVKINYVISPTGILKI